MQFIFVFILTFYSVWFLLSVAMFHFIPRLLYLTLFSLLLLSFVFSKLRYTLYNTKYANVIILMVISFSMKIKVSQHKRRTYSTHS